jgi:hypothetical protein
MISIIMSIGFAVDLSAHIVYAFVTAHGDEPKERVIGALGHIGWPIFQVIKQRPKNILYLCIENNKLERTISKKRREQTDKGRRLQ